MWKRLDSILTKWEKKGFKAANQVHMYGVNFLLICIGYQGYTFVRDYNRFFMDAREEDRDMYREGQEQEQEFPLNKNVSSRRSN